MNTPMHPMWAGIGRKSVSAIEWSKIDQKNDPKTKNSCAKIILGNFMP